MNFCKVGLNFCKTECILYLFLKLNGSVLDTDTVYFAAKIMMAAPAAKSLVESETK